MDSERNACGYFAMSVYSKVQNEQEKENDKHMWQLAMSWKYAIQRQKNVRLFWGYTVVMLETI